MNVSLRNDGRQRIRGAVAVAVLLLIASSLLAAELPEVIPDPSAGDWVVDRFAGNSTAGPVFFQGPARAVGGLGRCGACPLPDGRVLVPFHGGLAEVDREGTLRLVAEGQFIFATTGQVTAAVMAWHPVEKCVYVAGPNCVRRMIEQEDGPWKSEIVAGIPGTAGFVDGPAKSATFTNVESIVINSRGVVYLLDASRRIRRIENGVVSTVTAALRTGKIVDGPLAGAKFSMTGLGGNLCAGEDDDRLYLSDHWNFAARRIDLKAMTVSTVAGIPKPAGQEGRFNHNSDGPALTMASFNSGCAYVCYDPVHRALWCGGPDENRFRWLKHGELRTVIGVEGNRRWPIDGVNIPAAGVRLSWNAVIATDPQGGVYFSGSAEPSGLWRARNVKEERP